MAVLLLDTRLERSIDVCLPQQSYGMAFERCMALRPEVEHLVVVVGVPPVYPSFRYVDLGV